MTQHRITYGESHKVPGDVPYSSRSFHLSVELVVDVGDSLERATARAQAFVQTELKGRMAGLPAAAGAGGERVPAAPTVETYNPENPSHVGYLRELFSTLDVRSPKGRENIEAKLVGKPMSQLPDLIKAERANFFATRQATPAKSGGRWAN